VNEVPRFEFLLASLLRPELEQLEAYAPHDPPGIHVKLDANEAPPLDSAAVRDAIAREVSGAALERYPDPRALRLKEAIAKRTGAKASDLVVGTGSDEAIALLVNAVARPRLENPQAVVLTPTPSFVMYRVTARAHGLKPVEVPLDAGWDLDVGMMKRAIELMTPNVVFIASPNNPTGNRMRAERLDEVVCAAGEGGALAIVDEAYVDFASEPSVRTWRERHEHLGILRTLSKIGLAALRVGWLEAGEALVNEVDKVRQPFNVSALSQAAASAVLEGAWDDVVAAVARVRAARDALAREIGALDGFSVTPSEANFVWVKTPRPAEKVFDELVAKGVLVRSFHRSGGRLGTQLRVTVGRERDHERLLEALRGAGR
jgi:histidinol-phosphate aminotransferase